MGAPYRNEMKARKMLEDRGAECFIPMHYVIRKRGHVNRRMLVPAVGNLLFVHVTPSRMCELKKDVLVMQYKMYRKEGGEMAKVIVSDKEMENFIRVCRENANDLTFFPPGEIDLKEGTHIRIIGGPLSGVEGYFIKVQGKRKRKFLISIDNFITVATDISLDLIEVIK